jgi:hypothetical protein
VTREQKTKLIATARKLGVRCGALLQILRQGKTVPAGQHPAEVLKDIRQQPQSDRRPALHGVHFADADIEGACDALLEAARPNASPEDVANVKPLREGPRRPKKGTR